MAGKVEEVCNCVVSWLREGAGGKRGTPALGGATLGTWRCQNPSRILELPPGGGLEVVLLQNRSAISSADTIPPGRGKKDQTNLGFCAVGCRHPAPGDAVWGRSEAGG